MFFFFSLQMRNLSHENINSFLGMCTELPNICTVQSYCFKGSLQVCSESLLSRITIFCGINPHVWVYVVKINLWAMIQQDVLANDDINLDWMFKYSLVSDLANVSILKHVLSCDYIT